VILNMLLDRSNSRLLILTLMQLF